MQGATEQGRSGHLLYVWGVVLVYFSLNAITQFATSRTADLDQAEQLILSQFLEFGYGAQPPLYTYIVKVVFSLTGPGLAPLLGLKAALLSLLAGLLIALGHQFNFTFRQQLITVAGIVFIPQLIWEAQRDLTHSVLATTIAAATLLQVVRTRRNTTAANYIVLGGLIGLGLISKYNYIIFLAALILAVLLAPGYRGLLIDRRAIAAACVASVIAAPHLVWAVTNYEIAASSVHKFQAGTGSSLAGLAQAALSAIAFLTPLWLFSLILIATALKDRVMKLAKTDDGRLLLSLFAATMIIVAMFVMVAGAQQVKDRWYQPLLFYMPLLVAMLAMPARPAPGRWYVGLGVVLAAIVSLALPARTIVADKFNRFSRPNLPYPHLVESVSGSIREPAFVLAETNLLGGNARPFFPRSPIRVPTYSLGAGPIAGDGIVLCESAYCDSEKFRDWLGRNFALDTRSLVFNKAEEPYLYAPSHKMTIYWAGVRLPSPIKP